MFLSICSPKSSKARSSLPVASFCTRAETQIPPGSAALQACCDVHAVAEDVAILDHNVADVDADTELDTLVGGDLGVALGHAGLQLSRTVQRIDHAAELDEQAITRRLDEPAMMFSDLRIDQLGPDRREPSESAAFVCPIRRE